jgi:hypothetical protein
MKNKLIDISGLSPTTQDFLKIEIKRVLYRNICDLESDIKYYLDGSVRDEMQGWLEAAKNLSKQIDEK